MNYLSKKYSSHQQSGFSLIEALVAFMVISIGMLGVASLQTLSMRAGHTAVSRTAAIFSAQDILDRMRANTTQIANYAVDAAGMGADNNCNDVDPDLTGTITAAADCTSAMLAADDIFHWKRSLPPRATASITVAAPAAPRILNTVTVTINWTEREVKDTNLATDNNYSITVEM